MEALWAVCTELETFTSTKAGSLSRKESRCSELAEKSRSQKQGEAALVLSSECLLQRLLTFSFGGML